MPFLPPNQQRQSTEVGAEVCFYIYRQPLAVLYSVITAAVKQYQVESANTGHIPSVSFVTKYSIGRLVGLFVHTGDSDRQQDEAECRPSG